jgi:hypothetical protein
MYVFMYDCPVRRADAELEGNAMRDSKKVYLFG